MATIKVKFELTMDMAVIREILMRRGIAVNQANVKRLVDLVRGVPIQANEEFFETVPYEQEILLMYGFTFPTPGNRTARNPHQGGITDALRHSRHGDRKISET